MSTLVKVQSNGQMTIPRIVRSAVGLADGDVVEVKAVGKKIVITRQPVVDHSKLPAADEEYTPAQRRAMDARLAKSDEDIKRGRVYGPFDTHKEFVVSLRREAAKLRPKKNVSLRSP
jgi:AbrB family looped-hinge helix DNA binding protein